jgi:cell division protein FtsL
MEFFTFLCKTYFVKKGSLINNKKDRDNTSEIIKPKLCNQQKLIIDLYYLFIISTIDIMAYRYISLQNNKQDTGNTSSTKKTRILQ